MIIIGQSRSAPPPVSSGVSLAAAPTTTSVSNGTSRPIAVGPTSAGQQILIGVSCSSGAAVVSPPNADWTFLEKVQGGTVPVSFFGYIGSSANRPNNTSVTFTTDIANNIGGVSLILNGSGFGAHASTASVLTAAPQGPTEASLSSPKTPNSLFMYVISETGSQSVTGFTAPTVGFNSIAPGAYPAETGSLFGNATHFSMPNASMYLYWGSYGTGAFVRMTATAGGNINAGTGAFEILP
jgi:hypothetical protein